MKKKLNNKGLTLIEIIITLAILGVVVTPLMSMFVTSQRINRESEIKYRAIQLAQKYMEDVKSESSLDVSTGSGYMGMDGDYSREIPNDSGYRLVVSINENDVVDIDDVDSVDVPGDGEYDDIVDVTVPDDLKTIDIMNDDAAIRVNLKTDNGKLKVETSTFTGAKLYMFKDDSSYNYTISGNATVIEVQEGMDKPDNILYYITINVYDGARLIETVKGSKVFNSIITD